MTLGRNVNLLAAMLLVSPAFVGTAHAAWTGYNTVTNLAEEQENLLEIKLASNPTPICSDQSGWIDVPATATSPLPTYKTLAPLVMAAYLYNKSINLNIVGCDSLNRPIVIGVLVQ